MEQNLYNRKKINENFPGKKRGLIRRFAGKMAICLLLLTGTAKVFALDETPNFTLDPITGPLTYCPGEVITLKANPVPADSPSDAYTYQWYVNGVSSSEGTSATFTYSTASSTSGAIDFKVEVGNNSGTLNATAIVGQAAANDCKTVSFSKVGLTDGNLLFCTGNSLTLSATPAIKNCNDCTVEYQWFKDGNEIGSAAASYSNWTISSAAATDAGSYVLKATLLEGTTNRGTFASSAIELVYNVPPTTVPSVQASTATVCPGRPDTVTVTNAGDLSYGWYDGEIFLATGGGQYTISSAVAGHTYIINAKAVRGCASSGLGNTVVIETLLSDNSLCSCAGNTLVNIDFGTAECGGVAFASSMADHFTPMVKYEGVPKNEPKTGPGDGSSVRNDVLFGYIITDGSLTYSEANITGDNNGCYFLFGAKPVWEDNKNSVALFQIKDILFESGKKYQLSFKMAVGINAANLYVKTNINNTKYSSKGGNFTGCNFVFDGDSVPTTDGIIFTLYHATADGTAIDSGLQTRVAFDDISIQEICPVYVENILKSGGSECFKENGNPAKLSAAATGGTGNYSYQWAKDTGNGIFTNIVGATSSTYKFTSLDYGTEAASYQVTVTDNQLPGYYAVSSPYVPSCDPCLLYDDEPTCSFEPTQTGIPDIEKPLIFHVVTNLATPQIEIDLHSDVENGSTLVDRACVPLVKSADCSGESAYYTISKKLTELFSEVDWRNIAASAVVSWKLAETCDEALLYTVGNSITVRRPCLTCSESNNIIKNFGVYTSENGATPVTEISKDCPLEIDICSDSANLSATLVLTDSPADINPMKGQAIYMRGMDTHFAENRSMRIPLSEIFGCDGQYQFIISNGLEDLFEPEKIAVNWGLVKTLAIIIGKSDAPAYDIGSTISSGNTIWLPINDLKCGETKSRFSVGDLWDITISQYQNMPYDLERFLKDYITLGAYDTISKPGVLGSDRILDQYFWYKADPYAYDCNQPGNPVHAWIDNEMILANSDGGVDVNSDAYVRPWINTSKATTYTYYVNIDQPSSLSSPLPAGLISQSGKYFQEVVIHIEKAPDLDLDGEYIFEEHFNSADYTNATLGYDTGSGLNMNPLPDYAKKTNYQKVVYGDMPQDGRYNLRNEINNGLSFQSPNDGSRWDYPKEWYSRILEHTYKNNDPGNTSSYMYVVNADATDNGVFYQQSFPVCANTRLRFSLYMHNLDNGCWTAAYRIAPNVHIAVYPTASYYEVLRIANTKPVPAGFNLNDTLKAIVLAQKWTGDVDLGSDWEPYHMDFVSSEDESITVVFGNVTKGGSGNDFCIDDIRVERAKGKLNIITPSPACFENADTFSLNVDHSFIKAYNMTNVQYQWQKNGQEIDPADPGISAHTPPSGNFPASYYPNSVVNLVVKKGYAKEGDVFRLIVSDNNSSNTTCTIDAYYTFTKIAAEITSDAGQEICQGTEITLNATVLQGTGSLDWYFIPAETINEVLDTTKKVSLDLRGQSVQVTPMTSGFYNVEGNCGNEGIFISVNSDIDISLGSDRYRQGKPGEEYVYRECYEIGKTAYTFNIPFELGAGLTSSNYRYTIYNEKKDRVLGNGDLSSGSLAFTLGLNEIPTEAQFTEGIKQTEKVILEIDSNISGECPTLKNINIRFISQYAVWNPVSIAGNATNWNDDANWTIYKVTGTGETERDKNGNLITAGIAGIPMACTDVIMPGNMLFYPTLKDTLTGETDYDIADYYVYGINTPSDDNFTVHPKANNITFEMGGEIGRITRLNYAAAYVELNLGYMDNYQQGTRPKQTNKRPSSYFLERNRYYTLTAPLQDTYIGDYSFGGKPRVLAQYADNITYEGNRYGYVNTEIKAQGFTDPIPYYTIRLGPGFGFAYYVYSAGSAALQNQDNLNAPDDGVVTFPWFYKKGGSLYSDLNIWTAAGNGGTSTMRYYIYPTGEASNITDEMKRDLVRSDLKWDPQYRKSKGDTYKAHRFIWEKADGSFNGTLTSGYVNQTLDDESVSETLIGNPFMSHLNIREFMEENEIEGTPFFRIWNGAVFNTVAFFDDQTVSLNEEEDGLSPAQAALSYLTEALGEVDKNTPLIAPMQSFFVPTNSTNNVWIITPEMSTARIVEPESAYTYSLRSNPQKPEVMHITAKQGTLRSEVALVREPAEKNPGRGVPKIYNMDTSVPEIYLIHNGNLDIADIAYNTTSVGIGFRKPAAGKSIELSFSGYENFRDGVYLLDALRQTTTPITGSENSFTVSTDENTENRFFVVFEKAELTGMPETITDGKDNSGFQVYCSNRKAVVISSLADPLYAVKIYNTQGQAVVNASGLSGISFETSLPEGIYMIDVTTVGKHGVKKIMNY